MTPLKILLLGICIGLTMAGDIVLMWNAQKTFREYCTPTEEIENDHIGRIRDSTKPRRGT